MTSTTEPARAEEPRDLVVPHRFRGPTHSGNGGWTAGALAGLVADCPSNHADPWPTIEVTLRSAPPLDTPMTVTEADGVTTAAVGDRVVAQARVLDPARGGSSWPDIPGVPFEVAAAASPAYAGHRSHPFPECFSCGPAREAGDGLRIFPGPVPGRDGVVAAPWTPHPSMREDFHAYADPDQLSKGTAGSVRASLPVTWAALDCVGGWSSDLEDRPMVLGRISARIDTLPAVGEEHVVVGARVDVEGRRTFTAATLYDGSGRAIARATHVWFEVDPRHFDRPPSAG